MCMSLMSEGHELPPQQQQLCLSEGFFASFIDAHESPQQAIAQLELVFLVWSVCANARPLRAIPTPSTKPRAKPLKFFILILLIKDQLPDISEHTDTV
jgi:hypothetical protein